MPETRLFIVDAFTRRPFAGNPAAVVPLPGWPSDDVLQAIAAEMNLSETAFFVPEGSGSTFAGSRPRSRSTSAATRTLASAFVLMNFLDRGRDAVRFRTKSGALSVTREGTGFAMDFPSRPAGAVPTIGAVVEALGKAPVAMLRTRAVLAVFAHAEEVRALAPDMAAIAALPTCTRCR